MCARRRTYFLLLRQKKVGKEKATPLAVSLRFAAGNLRCSRESRCRRTHFALAALRSDNCGKSEHEAWASFGAPARLTRCASRHVQRGGKSNSGHRCARPGCRDVRSTSGRVAAAEAAFQDGAPHLRFPFSDSEVKDDTWVWAGSVQSGAIGSKPNLAVSSSAIGRYLVAPQTQGRAQRWPVWCPTPFWMRLGRGAGGVNRAPKDARAWCSNWPQLSERGCAAAK